MEQKQELVALVPQQISEMAQQHMELEAGENSLVFDYESAAGNKAARSHVAKLRKSKAAIAAVHKEAKADILEAGRKLDKAKRELTDRVEMMIQRHWVPLKDIEERAQRRLAEEARKRQEEEDRKRREEEARIAAEREALEAERRAIEEERRRVEEMRLAEERRIAAEKAEAERKEREAREAVERAEREAREAVERAEREKQEALRQQAEAEARAKAEEERRIAEEQARREREERAAAERARQAEAARQRLEQSRAEALEGFVMFGVEQATAERLLEAIELGKVLHVTFQA